VPATATLIIWQIVHKSTFGHGSPTVSYKGPSRL
jgi:hypothetical protein